MIESKEISGKKLFFKWYSIIAFVGYSMSVFYNGLYWVGLNFINEFEENVNFFKERADLKVSDSKMGLFIGQDFSQEQLNRYLIGEVFVALLCLIGLILMIRMERHFVGKSLVLVATFCGIFFSWYYVGLFFAPILIVFLLLSALLSLVKGL